MNTAVIHDGVAYFDGTERVLVSPCPHCDKPFQRVKAHITKNAVCRQKAQEAEAAVAQEAARVIREQNADPEGDYLRENPDLMRLIAERNVAMRAGDDEAFERTQTALNEATESETPVNEEPEEKPETEEEMTARIRASVAYWEEQVKLGEASVEYGKPRWVHPGEIGAGAEPEPEEDEEEGVKETCPHCGDEEVLTDRSFNPVWTERFPARVCWGCYSGEKDRECEDCGDTFTPCVDDTYVVCGDCYERQQGGKGLPLRDRIWSWLLSHADEYNGKTAREIAKALGEEKHAVNQALYADPSPFHNFVMAGQKAPVWRVRV